MMSRKLNQWASVGALCALAAGCAGDMQALKFWSTVDDAARVEDAIDPTEGSQADQEESASAAAGEVSADEQAGGALTTGPQALMTNEEGGDQSSPQINLAGGAENSRVRGFVRRAPTSDASLRRAGPVDHGTEELTLEFEGADLSSVVRVMMEEGLNANYLIDPSVQGTVTIRTNRPLTNGEILPTLEEILRMNDAALVERDGVFRILPRADAGLTAPLFSARDAAARGLSLRVTPLRFVSVEEVSEVLDAFAPVNGAIRYERSRNLVFSIGTASEQATILDAIDVLDADYFAGRSLALQPLREATAETLSGELVTAFASPSGAPSAAVRFLPIARMNAILIVADEASMLDEAMRLARDLDQGGAETPTLHVFTARRRRAADLALIIGDIFDAEVSGIASQNSFVAPNLSTSTGFSTIGGGRSGFGGGGAQAGLRAARTPGPPPPSATELTSSAIQVEAAPDFRRQRAGSGAPAGVFAQAAIDSVADGRFAGGGGGGLNGVVRVVADEASNAVVVLATAEGARLVEGALRRLDIAPLQVMIEATLVEVALNDALEFGVRWFFQSGDFDVAFSDIASPQQLFPGFNATVVTNDVNATITALDDVTDVRILSSPTLMVVDNQVARLQVGDQVPITTRSAQSIIDDTAPIVNQQEFRDTGVILQIRPTVSADGGVTLEVRQEVSDVQEATGTDNPTFAQRLIESTITVQSGETIALAGLIEDDSNQSREAIPVLGRIPLLGGLFGVTEVRNERSELIVLIRPTVIRDQTAAREATEDLRRQLINIDFPR